MLGVVPSIPISQGEIETAMQTAKSGAMSECLALLEQLQRRMKLLQTLVEEEALIGKKTIPPMSSISQAVIWILEHHGGAMRFAELIKRIRQSGIAASAENIQAPIHRVRIALQAMKRRKAGVTFPAGPITDDTVIQLKRKTAS